MSHHPRLALVLLTGITLALSACASGSEVDLTIHESERGAVYVERFPDLSFQAAHPITLSADTMARVLRGVVVQENRGFFRTLVTGKPEGVRVFKDEDVEYLAPLLVEGLTRAASDQQVGFRVVQSGTPAEWTKGSLYAYGRSLYLNLAMAHRRVPVRSRRARSITHDPLYPGVGKTPGQLSRRALNRRHAGDRLWRACHNACRIGHATDCRSTTDACERGTHSARCRSGRATEGIGGHQEETD